tara:strand:- start:5515 stop:6663 length:1149 start_codon:yes stop_codon:yes gene_type:complete
MISPEDFINKLYNLDIDFFTGVPDSLLKEFCAYIQDNHPIDKHIIAANEGSALALASGYQIATNKIPLIYLQNSGFGNLINPLLSLTNEKVYAIPALLLMGWRGEPGIVDEPQHIKQGEVTIPLLKSMEIPYFILDDNKSSIYRSIQAAIEITTKKQSPVVLLAKKGIFSNYVKREKTKNSYIEKLITREEAISLIVDTLCKNTIFVSSTGYISRELYELRDRLGQSHDSDFLTVGSMGHSSQIALGIALSEKERSIVCLDGDGAMIMHMGGLVTNGAFGTKNLTHIVLNNAVHDSVGGQPTLGFEISMTTIARGCKYKNIFGPCETQKEIKNALIEMQNNKGPSFVEIRIKPGAKKDLGRPKETPIQNKKIFISNLNRFKN